MIDRPFCPKNRQFRPRQLSAVGRRGMVTLWTLLFVVVLLTILYVVIQVAQLWLAREKLENAVEAAALAAVKQWGDDGGGTSCVADALARGEAYALANTVNGTPLDLSNPAIAPSVNWQFGSVVPDGTGYDFTADPTATQSLAVVLQTTCTTTGLFQQLFGELLPSSTVQAQVAAFYDTTLPSTDPQHVRLIRLND
jgi:Flp pilus assembly protein TadG